MKAEELINYQGPDRVVHWEEYLAEQKKKGQTHRKLNLGFTWLNEKLGGLQSGDVVNITGFKKNGKTLFAHSIIRNLSVCNENANPIVFYFETKPEVMMENWPKEVPTPVFIPLQLKAMDFGWLVDRCLEAKLKYRTNVVLIDHLHYQVDMNTHQNMSLNIGAFMRRLKLDLAIGLNMSVLLIAHQGQPKKGEEASADSMRDSSFIAQEADSTIVVSRAKNYDEVEIHDFENRCQDPRKIELLRAAHAKPDVLDDFSAGLAIVKVDDNRRTGAYRAKKLYIKQGDFLEEL